MAPLWARSLVVLRGGVEEATYGIRRFEIPGHVGAGAARFGLSNQRPPCLKNDRTRLFIDATHAMTLVLG